MIDKILMGDTLEMLKTLSDESIDMGVTSPPYNKQENKKGWLVKNVKYDVVSDKKEEKSYQQNQIEVLNELYRVIKPGGSLFYNHKTRWENGIMMHPITWLNQTDWLIRQEIIWDRAIAANIRGWRFWQVDERIYWLYKPKDKNNIGKELLSKHALMTSIWRFSPEQKNPHPAPFPLALPLRCIHSILDENEGIIIDPYAGSGTTCVASKLLNKNYIGIEMFEDYIVMAKDRIKNADKEIDIMLKETEKHKVNKTFKQRKEEGKWQNKNIEKIAKTTNKPILDLFS